MRVRTLLTAVLLTSTVIGACGSDDKASSDNGKYSVASSLRQIPASATGDGAGTLIMSGDIDKATELAGLERPTDPTSDEAIDWIQAISGQRLGDGLSDVMIMPLDTFRLTTANRMDEIDDEIGWSLLDVHTYAGVDAPPEHFASMTGTFDADEIDAAQGDRVDDIWSLGGDDFEVDLAGRSAARPLGQSLRTALKDGRLAESISTPTMRAWLDGKDTLADDEALVAVAEALDDHDVYSAALLADPTADGATPVSSDDTGDLAPFEAFGVGSAHDGDGAQAVLAYQFEDEDDAEQSADVLRAMFEDGTSVQTHQPWSERVRVDDVEVDGRVVVVTLDVLEGRSPGVMLQAILVREPFTVSP